MGSPAMSSSGLPGSLVEARRAGITVKVVMQMRPGDKKSQIPATLGPYS
jgi:hypothetical protein